MSADPLDMVLLYASRGWRIFAMSSSKTPLTPHGRSDATTDPDQIRAWWCQHPDAVPALATGEGSGVVAVDIDRHGDVDGYDTLEIALGVAMLPETAMSHTPSGGLHLLFRWPGYFVKSKANALGPGVDMRGDGGSIMLPPAPGRCWDPVYGFNARLAELPAWASPPPEPVESAPAPQPLVGQRLSRYAKAALERALRAILDAPAGQQRDTMNREAYSIGQLVAGQEIPAHVALAELEWVAGQIRSLDSRRRWRPGQARTVLRQAFLDGQRIPRERRRG